MAINPVLYKKVNYGHVKDFVPISFYVEIADDPCGSRPDLPAKSVPELIKLVKDSKTPLTYSSPGAGVAQHLSMEYMKKRFGLEITHVPYKSTPQSIADIVAGHVNLGFAESWRIAATHSRRQAAPLYGLGHDTPPVPARRAAFRGSGQRAGFRSGVMAHAVRAGGNAETDRRSSACRNEEDHG